MNQLYVYLKQCKLSVMIGKVEWKNISWSKTRRAETNEMTYYEHQSRAIILQAIQQCTRNEEKGSHWQTESVPPRVQWGAINK